MTFFKTLLSFWLLVLPFSISANQLVVDETHTQIYGFKYQGVNLHRETAQFTFQAGNNDLSLSITGYDIDIANEVAVHVNQQAIGYLAKTPNNSTGPSSFTLPASLLVDGENVLSFTQQKPGWKWGLTNLLLTANQTDQPDTTRLQIDVADTAYYGYNYQGVTTHPESAQFIFPGGDEDLTLELTGYDIDFTKEVAVLVNEERVGFLTKTPNNDTGPSSFSIPASTLVVGDNVLSFNPRTAGWKWGITNLLLSANVTDNNAMTRLQIDVADPAIYGFNFQGITTNRESAQFIFQGNSNKLTLDVTGYDIDITQEVAVLVNQQPVGFLARTPNNGTLLSSFVIPAELQMEGDNVLSFSQRSPGWKWGITDLFLGNSTPVPDIPAPPLLLSPSASSAIAHGATADFQWASSAEATNYQFELLRIDGQSVETLATTLIPASSCANDVCSYSVLFDFSVDGSLTWRVNASNDAGTSDWHSEEVFAAAPTVPDLSRFTLVFADEFQGTQLDPAKWDTGLLWGPYFPINNEEQLYVDTLGMHAGHSHSPFELTGDTLKITATPTSEDLQPPERPSEDSDLWQPNSYSEYRYNGPTDDGPGYQPSDVNYLSGIITSYESLKMTHGYVEMRAKLPRGRGLWPAFWMLTTHYVEDVPEIDVMEFLGQDVDTLYHTYHYFDVQDNWRKISTPSYTTIGSDWTQDFHTFGMAWSPTELIYYVDGEEVRRITDQDYVIPNQSMYLIANLAVGGNWPGSPDADTLFPATFEIDYIRAYKRKLQPELNLAADYQLMFEDEFNGSSLDESKWNTSFLWGPYLTINNEEQYYVDSLGSDNATDASTPFVMSDGLLSITARAANDVNSFPIPDELPDSNAPIWTDFPTFQRDNSYAPGNYTSGIITSYDSFNFVHGYAEMRARIPLGQGLWPAFWLLNGYYVGQQPEIDIMEVLGHNPHQAFHTYHRLAQDGILLSDQGMTNNGDPATGYADGFHTYGVRWQRGQIDWYIDGNVVHTYQGNDVPYQVMYVIANLAVGGNWPGSPDDTTEFPASMDIDYIRVYQERHKED